jgi:hypothetical protein
MGREGVPSVVVTGTLPFTRELRPTDYIKGLYITYYGLGSEAHRANAQWLLENTELNAIVMDVKGDFGWLPYTSTVQTALDIGAGNRPMIQDWAAWMQWLKERNIYTIARIVVFKDDPLATAHPEWAVLDAASGGVWHDREGLGWADPTRAEVWDYNIALAVEAAQLGFDEIQLDYVRFPSDGAISRATFAVENSEENRKAAITSFLSKASTRARSKRSSGLKPSIQTWKCGPGSRIFPTMPLMAVLTPRARSACKWRGPGRPGDAAGCCGILALNTRRKHWFRLSRSIRPIRMGRSSFWNIT